MEARLVDEQYLDKVQGAYSGHPHFRSTGSIFTLRHYAGFYLCVYLSIYLFFSFSLSLFVGQSIYLCFLQFYHVSHSVVYYLLCESPFTSLPL